MNMEQERKYQGTEMADIMWNMIEDEMGTGKNLVGSIYWEDCLEFADRLHRLGYRRVAEPETNDIIKGEVVE